MTDVEKLAQAIKVSGLKKRAIAENLGIAPYTLSKKLSNKTEFKASEIAKLSNMLGLNATGKINEIFFA